MMPSRPKRIDKTFAPNQTISGEKYSASQMNYFYRIKGGFDLLNSDRQKSKTNEFAKQVSFREKQIYLINRMPSKRSKSMVHKKQTDVKRQSDQNRGKKNRNRSALGRRSQEDFQLSNINKIISGTPLGALSQREIMKKLQNEGFEGERIPIKMIKRGDSEQQLGVSQLPGKIMMPSVIDRLKNRKSSTISNKSMNGDRTLNFIYGGQDFLKKYKEGQMILMEKVKPYSQKQNALDYKNSWKS